MPKIISAELKEKVITLRFMGFSRDEIARRTGLSQGTVSNILAEFEHEIGHGVANAIKELGRLMAKNNITPNESLEGLRASRILQRRGITEDVLNSFVSDLDKCLKSGINHSELLKTATQLLELQKSTDIPLDQIPSHCKRFLDEIPRLKMQIKNLNDDIKKLQNERKNALAQNKVVLEDLSEYVIIRRNLAKFGISAKALSQMAATLKEISRLGYDPKLVIGKTENIGNLDVQARTLENTLNNLNQNIITKKKEHDHIHEKLDNLKSEYVQFSDSIHIINKYLETDQDPSSIMQWNEVLQHQRTDIAKFDKQIRKHDTLENYNSRLLKSITSLEKHKTELEHTVQTLKNKQQEISELNKLFLLLIKKTLPEAEQKIVKLEGMSPYRMINEFTGDPYRVIPSLIIFFAKLQIWCQKNLPKNHRLARKINESILELKRSTIYVA